MSPRDWVQFEGNREAVGHALGLWWATKHPDAYDKTTVWQQGMRPLLANAARFFPEILEEVSGMTRGAIEGGVETSFLNMFAQALGETTSQCSSLVVQSKNGWVLGHDEQDEEIGPLCFSRVKYSKTCGLPALLSISYPFQLLGSACGANTKLSFQGNSIGTAGHATRLEETWVDRVPKTLFTRKLLEATSIEDVVRLYSTAHTTLPNHHFICGSDSAYACEIRPRLDSSDQPRAQLSLRRITAPAEVHTNHFMTRKGADRDWMWPADGDNRDSDERRDDFKERLESSHEHDADSVMQILRAHADKYPQSTLASVCFDTCGAKVHCNAVDLTGDAPVEMVGIKL